MSDSKPILRQEAIRHRVLIDPRLEPPDQAVEPFMREFHPQPGQVVAGYYPKDREFDPVPILERLVTQGIGIALPVVMKGSKILRFAAWDVKSGLEKGPFDILQPPVSAGTEWLEPDIVIVPLLAYDRRGYRLGYGGGYYDATLADIRAKKPVLAVGAAYAQQACLFNLPAEDHDQKLDAVVTPKGVTFFE